jgi:hypothetical protein
MKETAEQVTPTHPALLILTDDGHPSTSIRCFEPQRPVRTVLVVVLDVSSQDPVGARKSVVGAELQARQGHCQAEMIGI